jgi:type II secretory pathway pseudopilin PulG
MKKQGGFTVVELVVAMTLLVIIAFAFAPAIAFYYRQISYASQGEQQIFAVNEELNEQLALREREGTENPFDLTFSDGSNSLEGKVFGRDIVSGGVTTFEAAEVDAEGLLKYGIGVKPNIIVAAYDGAMKITANFEFENTVNFKLTDKNNATVSGAAFSITAGNRYEAELRTRDLYAPHFHPDLGPYTVTYRGPNEKGVTTDFTASFEIIRYPYMLVTADGEYYYGSLNTGGDMELIDMDDRILSQYQSRDVNGATVYGFGSLISGARPTAAAPRFVSDIAWSNGRYVASAVSTDLSRSDTASDRTPRLAVMSDLYTWQTLQDLGSPITHNRIYEARRLIPQVGGTVALLGRYLDGDQDNRVTLLTITDSGADPGNSDASDIALNNADGLLEGTQYNAGGKALLAESGVYILAGQGKEDPDNPNTDDDSVNYDKEAWQNDPGYNFNRGSLYVNWEGPGKDFKKAVELDYLPGEARKAENYPGYYTAGASGAVDIPPYGNVPGYIFITYKRWLSGVEYGPGVIVGLGLDAGTQKFLMQEYSLSAPPGPAVFLKQPGYNSIAYGAGTVEPNSINQTENWVVVGENGLILYLDASDSNRFRRTEYIYAKDSVYSAGSQLSEADRFNLCFTRVQFIEGSFYAMGYRGESSRDLASDGKRNPLPAPLSDAGHGAALFQSKDGGRTWYEVVGLSSGFADGAGIYATEVVGIAHG